MTVLNLGVSSTTRHLASERRFQFSIRQLLIVTAIVAVLTATVIAVFLQTVPTGIFLVEYDWSHTLMAQGADPEPEAPWPLREQ